METHELLRVRSFALLVTIIMLVIMSFTALTQSVAAQASGEHERFHSQLKSGMELALFTLLATFAFIVNTLHRKKHIHSVSSSDA